MKILLVSQYYHPERFSVTDIAEALHSFGHEVTVLTGKPNYGYDRLLPGYRKIRYEVINGVEVHRVRVIPRRHNHFMVSLNYLSFYFNGLRFARHLRDEFDVVMSVSLSPVISIAPAIAYAKRHHVPHVLFCLDIWPEATVVTGAIRMNSFLYRLLYAWSVRLYRQCDAIIVSSPSFIEYFHDVLKIKDIPFHHVCQPALSTTDHVPDVVYQDRYNIVYAGNIGTLQLIDRLVEAMELLKGEHIRLHLAGLGSYLPRVQALIEERHLSDRIIYHGILPLAGVEAYYRSADALIVSLLNKGTVGKTIPNKAIQYLKYARPIIGILKGDGRDLLAKTGGVVFAEEDPRDIARVIKETCQLSVMMKERLGARNRSYYLANLTTEKLTHSLEDVLKEARKRAKDSP